jgi:hypothetical protein
MRRVDLERAILPGGFGAVDSVLSSVFGDLYRTILDH